MKIAKPLMLAASLVIPTTHSNAALVAYTDQAVFLSDMAALGSVVHDGFEGSAWDGVRSSISEFVTAPNVSSLGVTWASSNPSGGVTTGSGPALSSDNANWYTAQTLRGNRQQWVRSVRVQGIRRNQR